MNLDHLIQGSEFDTELNERGVYQMHHAADALKNAEIDIDYVVHTGMKRTKKGAEVVSNYLGAKTIEYTELRERWFGDLGGKKIDELERPDLALSCVPSKHVYPEIEDGEEFLRRIKLAWGRVLKWRDPQICVVGHAGVLDAYLTTLGGKLVDSLHNGHISVFNYKWGKLQSLAINLHPSDFEARPIC